MTRPVGVRRRFVGEPTARVVSFLEALEREGEPRAADARVVVRELEQRGREGDDAARAAAAARA